MMGFPARVSSRVREVRAPRCSTWTSAEIAPFCSLVFPPVLLSLPGIGRAVDTKISPPTLALLECLGGVAQFLLNQSMKIVFHEYSAHLVQLETAAGGWDTPQVARRRCPAMPLPTCSKNPLAAASVMKACLHPAGCPSS
jgi:hypothetical protein